MEHNFTIYTDGGSRGNPGPSGVGWVIEDSKGKEIDRNSKFLGTKTNNWAEYEAVALALKDLRRIVGSKKIQEVAVEVKMDSQLVVKQLSGEYQIKEESLFPQYIKVHNMRVKDFPQVIFTHVPREENTKADGLANEAMDSRSGDLFQKHT